MGKRGPRPKPTAIRLVNGNAGKRPLNNQEPVPPPGRPACPRWLNAEARKEWQRIVPILEGMGVLSLADRSALAARCATYARLVEAEELLAKTGPVVKAPSGYVMPSPLVSIVAKCHALLRAWDGEFGLTPSARSGIATAPVQPEDKFEQFLKGKVR